MKKVKEDIEGKQNEDVQADSADAIEQMEVEGARIYNKKTLRDQYGNYPAWMSKRKIMKHKKGRAKSEKATKKTSKRLTRRQKKVMQQKN